MQKESNSQKKPTLKKYIISAIILCILAVICISVSKKSIDSLIAELKNKDNEINVRGSAALALGEKGDIRAVEPLIAALEDISDYVRVRAAEALGEIGDSRAIEPLVDIIEDIEDNCCAVRLIAALALDKLGWQAEDEKEKIDYLVARCQFNACVKIGSPAVEPLIAVLNSDREGDEHPRYIVARSLGEIGDTRAVEPLIAVLEDEDYEVEHYDVRQSASSALGNIGDRRAVPALVSLLKDWSCGPYAYYALLRFDWKPESIEDKVHYSVAMRDKFVLVGMWEETESVLLEDLLSNEYSTMENAIYAFIGIGQQEIIPALINTLNSKGNRTLAKAYFNCGQEELESVARSWAKINEYPITVISGDAPVEWDSW